MADNILKGIIKLEAQGVTQTTSQVASALSKTEGAFKATKNAGFAFNQVLREAPAFAFSVQTGLIGISNNLPILTDAFNKARASGASTGQIFKNLGAQLFTLPSILSLGITALTVFGGSLFGASEASKKLKEESEKAAEAQKRITEDLGKERSLVDQLVTLIKSETATREQKEAALKKLAQVNPQYFGDLKTETGLIQKLDTVYKGYLKSLVARSEVAALTQDLDKLSASIVELERQGASTEIIAPEVTTNLQGQLVITKKITKEQAEQTRLNSQYNEAIRKRDAILNQIGGKTSALSDNLDLSVPQLTISPKKIKVKPLTPIKDLFPDFGEIQFPPEEVAPIVRSFGEMFQGELSAYFNSGEPFDRSIGQAMEAWAKGEKIRAAGRTLAATFNDALSGSLIGGIAAIGEGIGNVLSGKGFGAGLVNVIGDLLTQLGKALLAYGAIKTGLDKILGAGGIAIPGVAALALGATAIAFGQVFKNFGGFKAAGGPVQAGRGYIVGERGPEWFNPGTNGSIIPNNQLSSYRGGNMAGSLAGRVVFEISGNKLRGILKRADMSALGLE